MRKYIIINKKVVALDEKQLEEYFKQYISEIEFYERIINKYHSVDESRINLILNKAIQSFFPWLKNKLKTDKTKTEKDKEEDDVIDENNYYNNEDYDKIDGLELK